ncbi:MAG: 3-phosphoshikimate 1-carboxyvinyltransferase [Candidatus Omnitrophota bacterium]|nr:3-phosphoshikimate 1-carboxyvinyltransferase [Candidatus Omnitrophota bacterium]
MRKKRSDNIIIEKATELIGAIEAPPSKSYTHRAIMACGINGKCRIQNPLYSDDIIATINAWKTLGAVIKKRRNFLDVRGFHGLPDPKNRLIDVGESGTLLRFILPILALAKGEFIISGRQTLMDRPNRTIVEALKSWDIDVSGKGDDHKLPIRLVAKGEIEGGETRVSGRESSQTISSLLMAAPLAKRDTIIIVKDKLVSKPYVDVTIDVLRKAGIEVVNKDYRKFHVKCGQRFKPLGKFIVPGDYSSSAFAIVAASLLKSDVAIMGLGDDKQGDNKIIEIVNAMGGKIRHAKNTIRINGPFALKGIDIDCGDTPDLVPILAVLGCFAKGKTRIHNVAHLAYKESDRIAAPAGELMKLGAAISTTKDSMTIKQSRLRAGNVSSRSDHRIAMALTVAGLIVGDVRIDGVECISKSYPRFLQDMKSLGAKFKVI